MLGVDVALEEDGAGRDRGSKGQHFEHGHRTLVVGRAMYARCELAYIDAALAQQRSYRGAAEEDMPELGAPFLLCTATQLSHEYGNLCEKTLTVHRGRQPVAPYAVLTF